MNSEQRKLPEGLYGTHRCLEPPPSLQEGQGGDRTGEQVPLRPWEHHTEAFLHPLHSVNQTATNRGSWQLLHVS